MGTLTVRVTPEIEEILSASGRKSAAATSAIECWMACEKESKRRIKTMLTAAQLKAIIDVVNSLHLIPSQGHFLRYSIDDAIRFDNLAAKWSLDTEDFGARMDNFSMADWIVLYRWAKAFWSMPDKSFDDYVGKFSA